MKSDYFTFEVPNEVPLGKVKCIVLKFEPKEYKADSEFDTDPLIFLDPKNAIKDLELAHATVSFVGGGPLKFGFKFQDQILRFLAKMGDFKPDRPEMMMHDEQDREPSPSGLCLKKATLNVDTQTAKSCFVIRATWTAVYESSYPPIEDT